VKIKLSEIRRLIEAALDEAEGNQALEKWVDYPDASFDVKIDSYLVDSESKPENVDESFIFEAEGDEETTAPDAEKGEESATLPADQPEMNFDAAGYSTEVAHLVDNYDSLFDIKGIIIRRALNFVGKKYTKEQSDAVKDVLETQFGLHLDEEEEGAPPAPPGDRAGPSLA
jgi:hypothetical protein